MHYPASRAFLSDKSFGMYKVIRVSSIHVAQGKKTTFKDSCKKTSK